MTKYYRDGAGNYLGGFDGAPPPTGAIEVPGAPSDARATWNGAAWVEPPPVDPADTPTTAADLARALSTPGVTLPLTQARIDTAKRNRP